MTPKPKPPTNTAPESPSDLSRYLFEQSAVFTRAAHALEAAADQLREAHGNDFERAATEVRSASLVAMHAALSAHQLVGTYELAAWYQRAERATAGSNDDDAR
jgi:carbohydrate-selective porin OprB